MRKMLTERLEREDPLATAERNIAEAYPDGVLAELRWAVEHDAEYAAKILDALALLLHAGKLKNKDGTLATTKEVEDFVRPVVPGLRLVRVPVTSLVLLEESENMAKNPDFRELLAELPRQNWSVTMTTQGHWRAAPPDKALTIVHFSESDDPHAQMNILRDLRKRGFVWPAASKNGQAGAERMATDPTDKLQTELERDVNAKAPPRRVLREMDIGNGQKATVLPAPTLNGKPHAMFQLEALASAPLAVASTGSFDVRVTASTPELKTEKTEDQLYAELKEARLYDSLAGDHLKECQKAVEEATMALAEADREKKKALEDLAKKRTALFSRFPVT